MRKAMSLHEREWAPAHETRMLGGIACYWIPVSEHGNDKRKKRPEYCVNPNNPVNCSDAQSNETPRAKAAEVAVGKRMLELEKIKRE